jgi:hypothetical protein
VLCPDCALLPPFTYSGLVADCVVAFVEMDQNKDVIDVYGAYLVLQEKKKILGSSVMESK